MNKLFIIILMMGISFSQVTGLAGWNIFLDPGHSQTQNMGVNGYSEAEEVLRVALQLKDLLVTQTDIDTVYLSRTNDQQNVSLYQRTNYANTVGAAWYHSIHSNAGAPDHNNTLLLWGQLYNGQPDPPVGGEGMSAIMIDLLTQGMRIPTIGSWGDCSFYSYSSYCQSSGGPYLYVNRNTNMPSELSEEGHHTNPAQNQLDMNEDYKRLLAYTFYWSILDYHNIPRPSVGICTGIISDLESGEPINEATVRINGQTYTTDSYASLFYQYSNDPSELRNGFYFIENLPDTVLTLTVEAENYYSDTINVAIQSDFFTFQDIELLSSAPPRIVATEPEEGYQGYPAWDPIRIDFSRSMNQTGFDTLVSFTPEIPYYLAWMNNHKTLKIYPDSSVYEQDMTLTILSTAEDIYGHQLDGDGDGVSGGDFQLHYRSSASDIDPPQIISVYPPAYGNHIELSLIPAITFDEYLGNPDTIDQVVYLENFNSGSNVNTTMQYYTVGNRSVINLFPQEALLPEEVYVLRILPGLYDTFGNTEISWHSYSFQTGNLNWNITGIDNFETGVMANWWDPAQSGSTTGTVPEQTGLATDTTNINLLYNGQQSMRLNYGWNTGATEWLIREYLGSGDPYSKTFSSNRTLQAYVFGDGNGTLFRFCVDDNYPTLDAGNHEVSPWFTIDWIGWKRVAWNMATDGTGEWLGDGTLDGTLHFDSFQFSYTPGNPPSGQLYIDDLQVIESVTLATGEDNTVPREYALQQNYPNPFNPSTTIRFSLPVSAPVALYIYSLTGERVRTLLQDRLTAGFHDITFDGRDDSGALLASGIYIYTLQVNNSVKSHRMILLR